MPRHHRPAPAAFVGNTPDEVEAQFYEALRRADLERMMAVWADDDDIVCIHPSGGRVVGMAAIRASFDGIFGNGPVPAVPEQVRRLQWVGGALHHLVERIDIPAEGGQTQTAWALVINVYVKTPQGWRMAAHHASPASLQEPPGPGDAPATLH
ncbi:MAG: nuclear transport factor 2 family protein [Rubrivivax sp.]|nr:nuclear transport factor 2 family protein [Rubrivivax sp.]MCL4696252.1 nuclear transport factor 2 family protein [Burkholderiaceae bacterium]